MNKIQEIEIKNKIDNLPTNMKPKDLAGFLGVSMTTVYKLVKSPGFPVLKLNDIRRVVIPKHKFLEWYEQCNTGHS